MQKVKLDITGMHCGACAMGIEMLVSHMDGVKSVSIDYNTKKGELEYDEAKISPDQIFQEMQTIGYGGKVIQ